MTRFRKRRGRLSGPCWVLVAAAAGVGCASHKTSDRNLVYVDVDEAEQMAGGRQGLLGLGGRVNTVWVDPRSRQEYDQAHIRGAVHLPLGEVATRHTDLDQYDLIIVYGTGYRDALAEGLAKRLVELGHRDVRMLSGGLQAWRDAGGALEQR